MGFSSKRWQILYGTLYLVLVYFSCSVKVLEYLICWSYLILVCVVAIRGVTYYLYKDKFGGKLRSEVLKLPYTLPLS